jgi:magnesium chelatase family protein
MQTFSRVFSAQPHHLSGHIVSVEVDITNGLHNFSIVGLADKAIDESRDRVSSAIKNSGYTSPKQENHKTVVSLAPAELRKEGSYYDLAIAIGYLLSCREIDFDPSGKIFVGELSLNGELKPVTGILPIVRAARDAGFNEVFIPLANADEASLISDIKIYGAKTLREIIDHLDMHTEMSGYVSGDREILPPNYHTDFKTIRGQETAKRGLEIAAAGGHNVIMSGPPGTGKTMLARAFSSVLPKLAESEMLEVTGIHSIAGTLSEPVIAWPPFRSPHHTASHISIIGGGGVPKPGEVTLAHHGVLFMDEFPEFDTRVIEALRQPIEDKMVNIARARGSASFPARFTLIAAMN